MTKVVRETTISIAEQAARVPLANAKKTTVASMMAERTSEALKAKAVKTRARTLSLRGRKSTIRLRRLLSAAP
ncbi:hypothetical protein D3C86_2110650 [compost metagenome]